MNIIRPNPKYLIIFFGLWRIIVKKNVVWSADGESEPVFTSEINNDYAIANS